MYRRWRIVHAETREKASRDVMAESKERALEMVRHYLGPLNRQPLEAWDMPVDGSEDEDGDYRITPLGVVAMRWGPAVLAFAATFSAAGMSRGELEETRRELALREDRIAGGLGGAVRRR